MTKWLLLIALAACSPVGTPLDVVVCADAVELAATQQKSAVAPQVAAPIELFEREMSADLDPRLLPFFQESSRRYDDRLGLRVASAAGGIPFTIEDEVVWRGQAVDAVAYYDKLCVFDQCTAAISRVVFAAPLLDEKLWAMQQTMDHELGHIISGWGTAIGWPQHFKKPGHLLSPGCVDHVCAPWTAEDAAMLCAGAPCTKIDLP